MTRRDGSRSNASARMGSRNAGAPRVVDDIQVQVLNVILGLVLSSGSVKVQRKKTTAGSLTVKVYNYPKNSARTPYTRRSARQKLARTSWPSGANSPTSATGHPIKVVQRSCPAVKSTTSTAVSQVWRQRASKVSYCRCRELRFSHVKVCQKRLRPLCGRKSALKNSFGRSAAVKVHGF